MASIWDSDYYSGSGPSIDPGRFLSQWLSFGGQSSFGAPLTNLGLGVPVEWTNAAIQNDVGGPGALINAGRGALNPATTPGGAANPVATATGVNTPTEPSDGGSTNPGQSAIQSGGTPGTIQNYFIRATVIILGFIFVAVGLSMFGGREIIGKVVGK